ncbi:MAG TPA: hypothetical protein VKG92_01415, partial [Flavobacteriales bacterium]|nr:hypothetical protein [Flavobacteriales bacterium]
ALMGSVLQMLSSVSEAFPWGDSNREGLHLIAIPYVLGPAIILLTLGAQVLCPVKRYWFILLLMVPLTQIVLVFSAELSDAVVISLVCVGLLFLAVSVGTIVAAIRNREAPPSAAADF